MIHKKWIFEKSDINLINKISENFNISTVIAELLVKRGITDYDEAKKFLYPDTDQFYDPYTLKDMSEAVSCIRNHILLNNKIAVYGDYDVDGITSTFILYDYLKTLGVNCIYYIPDRDCEGYGLNTAAIDKLKAENVKLIITVDVGITAVEEVEYASDLNIDMIITDHHTPKEILPKARAIINPKTNRDNYLNKNLAGVGVAFKLVYALSDLDSDIIDKYCAFACIGTIADMVPIIGENRFIAHYGLKCIAKSDNCGLNALIEVSGIDKNSICSSNISFGIAPRLNAAGRIASARSSVDLFLQRDYVNALKIALYLDDGNKTRQELEHEIFDCAIKEIEDNKLYENKVIIVAGHNWHHGVIGIVSSKITEKYYKPSAVISICDDGNCKASGRSIEGFNLFNALSYNSEYLTKFGGHELAAGFSLTEKNLHSFTKKINEYADGIMTKEILTPKLYIDAEIDAGNINLKLAEELKALEPFGMGNKIPIFCIKDAQIGSIHIHHSGKHVFMELVSGNTHFKSPAFNMADISQIYSEGEFVSVAGTVGINCYRGIESAQFIIRDINSEDKSHLDDNKLRMIFVCIKECLSNNIFTMKYDDISNMIKKRYNCMLGHNKLDYALKIFSELKLIEYKSEYGKACFSKGENYSEKCTLNDSQRYNKFIELY